MDTSNDMTDGYGDEESSNRTLGGGVDFFSGLGSEHKRKDPNEDKPDPSKLQVTKMELNQQLVQGKALDDYETKGECVGTHILAELTLQKRKLHPAVLGINGG